MTKKDKILLVDDDVGLLKLLKMRLLSEGYLVDTAESGEQALQRLDFFDPDLVISDLRMDGMDGLALFEQINEAKPFLPVVIMTAHGTIPEAVEATQKGVYSFITKPLDKENLLQVIQKALSHSGKNDEDYNLSWCSELLTQSQLMKDLLVRAKMSSRSDSHLVIVGENGTGRSLLASCIHKASRRKDGPFLKIDCSSFPTEQLESELFGDKQEKGLLFKAKGGTLLLQGIADLPHILQRKLLQILEGRRVGISRQIQHLDVRIIASTTDSLKNLDSEIFLRELAYCLGVIELEVPSLDQRREDISLLAKSFLKEISARQKPRVKSFSPKALELISNASWPGNVRQLRQVIEQLVVLSTSSVVSCSSVQSAILPEQENLSSLAEAKSQFERQYLIKVLRQAKGNVSKAARAAQRNRTDFYKLMARHQLQPAQFKHFQQDEI